MSLFPQKVLFTGTQINYFVVCKTKLWYFSHFLYREQDSDLVSLGEILHKTSYENTKKDIVIDSKISVDFIKKGKKLILHEVKKSNKLEKAHVMQLLYYIYYLKNEKGIDKVEGIINYPLQKRVLKVKLSKEKREKILKILREIKEILSFPHPPKPIFKSYCQKCSYFELCFC